MAHVINLLTFYVKHWIAETKLIYGILQAHFSIFVFSFLLPSLSFLTIPFLLTFVLQLFYSDWTKNEDFYRIYNIRLIQRHYAKIMLLCALCASFLIHFSLIEKQMQPHGLLILAYWSLIFGLFFFVKSMVASGLLFMTILSASSFIASSSKDLHIHFLLLTGLIICNGLIYHKKIIPL